MSDLIEYFVRHYTLLLDNGPYFACQAATRAAILEETPEVTLAEYRAMSEEDRITTYAESIGASILGLIEEWTDQVLDSYEGEHGRNDIGLTLIREVLITNGSDMAYELGKHYLPEDSEADEFLTDDDTDDMQAEQRVRY